MTSISSALTVEQVDAYFERIQLPKAYRRDQHPALDLSFLSRLQGYHVTAIPYENLSLHYAKDVKVSLDVAELHKKLVLRRRGGYCMENNILFHHVLLFLGFEGYLAGARLFRVGDGKSAGWSGWEHSVNIVTLDQQKYLVDVGYGGNGPRSPLPLVKGSIHKNIGTQTMRLVYEPLPGSRQRQWIYQTRNAEDQPWIHNYTFTEIEFFQRDFEVMSFFTSCHSDCFLTTHLLVVKYLREGDEVYGKIVLDDDKVKKNQGGKNVLVQMCMTERERVKALKDQFGIELTEEEQKGIQGRMSALAIRDC
ncbi:arylamine N-acetyltransferase 1 [Aspergillus pseudotamarii]|uniref:Arylamine N-acetyltransferase 1 n=1 Tax=Aspergillus pseudotamarii TaxID=132259 RepID=A0A5N6TAT8_ASPPS|nr:arylamine N-acetyltransferase 1 [Aspergillus pseudotamarii]KAE8143422.1 arylamine N-acetyltransferase 1 [Aspergillus pseudotamarii]